MSSEKFGFKIKLIKKLAFLFHICYTVFVSDQGLTYLNRNNISAAKNTARCFFVLCVVVCFNTDLLCASRGDRTPDRLLKRELLYQLSYGRIFFIFLITYIFTTLSVIYQNSYGRVVFIIY